MPSKVVYLCISLLFLKIKDAAATARQTDTGHIRLKGIQYILPNPERDTLLPPIPESGYKSDRGFHHPVIAKLLCPARLIDEFVKDPQE